MFSNVILFVQTLKKAHFATDLQAKLTHCEIEKFTKIEEKKLQSIGWFCFKYIFFISALGSNEVILKTAIVQERWFSMWQSQSALLYLLNHWDRLFCDSFQTKKVFLMVFNYRSNDAMLLNKSLRWNSGLVSGFACKRLEIDIKFNFPGHSIWLLHWLLEQPHFMDRERLLPDIPPSVWPFWTTGRQVKIFSGQQHLKPNTTSWLIHNDLGYFNKIWQWQWRWQVLFGEKTFNSGLVFTMLSLESASKGWFFSAAKVRWVNMNSRRWMGIICLVKQCKHFNFWISLSRRATGTDQFFSACGRPRCVLPRSGLEGGGQWRLQGLQSLPLCSRCGETGLNYEEFLFHQSSKNPWYVHHILIVIYNFQSKTLCNTPLLLRIQEYWKTILQLFTIKES